MKTPYILTAMLALACQAGAITVPIADSLNFSKSTDDIYEVAYAKAQQQLGSPIVIEGTECLIAKYDEPSFDSEICYTGSLIIPDFSSGRKFGLGNTTFTPYAHSVPDTGGTFTLLALGLGLMLAAAKIRKQVVASK